MPLELDRPSVEDVCALQPEPILEDAEPPLELEISPASRSNYDPTAQAPPTRPYADIRRAELELQDAERAAQRAMVWARVEPIVAAFVPFRPLRPVSLGRRTSRARRTVRTSRGSPRRSDDPPEDPLSPRGGFRAVSLRAGGKVAA